jgi:hypothetical protein
VDINTTDLVRINGITRVLLVVSRVSILEATYYPFDSQVLMSLLRNVFMTFTLNASSVRRKNNLFILKPLFKKSFK